MRGRNRLAYGNTSRDHRCVAATGIEVITGDRVDAVIALLDTSGEITGTGVSCIAAALREARVHVGRDPATGKLLQPEHGLTWSGALVYLIFCEQIGSCFSLPGHE